MRKLLAALLLLIVIPGAPLVADDNVTVIRAARLIDGTGAAPIERAAVVVTGKKITRVGTAAAIGVPSGASVIDLGNVTLLPGFIDSHTHLIGRELGEPGWEESSTRDLDAYSAIRGVAHAERTLLAGVTGVRNLGAGGLTDVALRQAIDEGIVPGPRMQVSANALGITGGHCDTNGYRPGILEGSIKDGIADGVDQVRAAVRYQVKYGADVIKTCATGGVLSEGDAVGTTQYSFEELKAIVDEATKLERRVAAHAHGTEGIKLAVRAGVASIEHGSFLDEEGAKLMAERGTYLVPTISAIESVSSAARSGVLKGLRGEKALTAAAAAHKAIKFAIAANVPIAMGTDAGVGKHGMNLRELGLMVSYGMKPADVLVAATMGSARLLGWEKRVGSIEAGKLADLVAVPGNPLEDITVVERVSFVMKDGAVVKRP